MQFTLHHNSYSPQNRELGYKWSHSYLLYLVVDSPTGNVTVHWGDKRCDTYTRQSNGTYTPPTGVNDTLAANGSPISSYDLTTKEAQVRYRFTNPNGTAWLCTSITDPNGHTLTHNYDAGGRLVSEVDALGYTQSYGWDSNNNLTALTDKRGSVWGFGYDSRGNLTSSTDPLGNTTTYTYNSRNRLLTVTTPMGNQVVNTYDNLLNWNLVQSQQRTLRARCSAPLATRTTVTVWLPARPMPTGTPPSMATTHTAT